MMRIAQVQQEPVPYLLIAYIQFINSGTQNFFVFFNQNINWPLPILCALGNSNTQNPDEVVLNSTLAVCPLKLSEPVYHEECKWKKNLILLKQTKKERQSVGAHNWNMGLNKLNTWNSSCTKGLLKMKINLNAHDWKRLYILMSFIGKDVCAYLLCDWTN